MNLWNDCEKKPITELLEFIVDNRGKTVPTTKTGHILIATNCIKNDSLYPKYEKIRFLSQETYETFFRSHPLPGDIIFVNKGTPGRVCLVPEPVNFCIAQDMIALRANKKKVDNHYLFAVLRSPMIQAQIHNTYVGDVIPHFKKQFMDRLLIPIPSMAIQKKIGDIYYTLCDKIEVNRRINEQLEELAGALFKSWFVDFEPFKDGEFVDSELGMIPKGWKVGTLGDIAGVVMGSSPAGSSYNTEGNGSIFYQGRTDFGFRFPCVRMYTTEPKRFAESNSVLLSVRAPVGDVNIAFEKCCIGRGLASIKSNCNADSYTYYLMKSLKPILDNYNNEGTVFGCINKDALNNLSIVVPTIDIIKEFEQIVSSFDVEIRRRSEEIHHLTTLRDTLLPKLMSGEIDVNEVEI
ncbi:MAG: restriction endonuclease subunit S [Bacteroidaceae bacterium]|nr:restriction endonuclease subunit S [Bacteroidaceae bacterium]